VGAGRSLGRFADLLPGAADALARAAGTERARWPLELPAELVWQPRRLRSGNVAVRPAVHAWEIPVGVSPGVEPSRAIPLGELTVAVRDGRLSVRWPARGADLSVTAGHLLNHWQAPAACRFLAEVGRDGRCQLHGFDWGLAERFPFLPRVQAGRVVLRPARWRVDPAELPAADAAGFAAAAARWRAAWRVPRLVQLGAGDNRLLLDLEDARQVEELRRELRRARPGHPVVLLEALPGPGHAWLPGPGGRYAVELAVPLVRRAPRPPGPGPGGPARDAAGATSVPGGVTPGHAAPGGPGDAADRLRPPGSEWLFVKLYCAPEDEEALLAGPVRALAEGAVRAGLAEGWFFVRYADPARHVRLRLRGDPARLAAELLPGVCAWAAGLVEDGACSRFCIDCYEREVDRYGGPAATALAERLFAADSRLVAELLAAGPFGEPGRAGPHRLDRVALAVLTVDDLLDGLRLDPAARLDLYRGWVAARHESGPAWRRRKAELRPLLADPARLAERAGGAALLEHLAARRAAARRVAGGLEALAARGELATPVATLARSYAHMHCNRLLGLGASAERAVLGLALRARESLDRAPVPG